MLIDLLNPSNYVMINLEAINVLGLINAAYCSELIVISKKAVKKNKTYNKKFFKIDREYIKERLNISIEEQLRCDLNLANVGIIEVNPENPDIISIDIEKYASILASEDIKLQDEVNKAVSKPQNKVTKRTNKDRHIINLKETIDCRNVDVLFALRTWIDNVFENNKYLTKTQVALFKDKLDDYCNGDVQKALKLIEIATIHTYIDCQWAINIYEKENVKFRNEWNNSNTVRKTEQRISSDLAEEEF